MFVYAKVRNVLELTEDVSDFVCLKYFSSWSFRLLIPTWLSIMKIPLSERAFLGSNSKLVFGQRKSRNPLLRRKVPPIPSAAHWGWGYLPTSAKILMAGILCGLISVTTPFWASVKTDISGRATYGLWHFCRGEDCTSIHDNILEGSSVPGCLCIFLDRHTVWLCVN